MNVFHSYRNYLCLFLTTHSLPTHLIAYIKRLFRSLLLSGATTGAATTIFGRRNSREEKKANLSTYIKFQAVNEPQRIETHNANCVDGRSDGRTTVYIEIVATKWNHAEHVKHAKIQVDPKRVVLSLNYISCSQQFIKSEIQQKKKKEETKQHQRLMVSAGVFRPLFGKMCCFFISSFGVRFVLSQFMFLVINLRKINFSTLDRSRHQTVAFLFSLARDVSFAFLRAQQFISIVWAFGGFSVAEFDNNSTGK